VAEAQAVLALLAGLRGNRAKESARTLARFLDRTEDAPLVGLLSRRLDED
jgi:hypothetical protein